MIIIDTINRADSEIGVSVPNLPGYYQLEMTVIINSEGTLESSFPIVYVRGPEMPASFNPVFSHSDTD